MLAHWPQISMAVWLLAVACGSIAGAARHKMWVVLAPTMVRKVAGSMIVGAVIEAATLYCGGFWR